MTDRMNHIIAGLVIAGTVAVPVYADTLSLFAGIWAALFSAAFAAGAKEFADNNHELNEWDWKDFGFTMLGAAAVIVFVILLHIGKG